MTKTIWLTVAEASLLARQMGLDRTNKTIRSWCRANHVTAEKQTNRTGEIWVLDRQSLITKIKSEIEFRDQERTTNLARQTSEQVRTSTDPFEPVQTGANPEEPSSQKVFSQANETLKTEISSLRMEVRFNEKLAEQFKKEYLKGQEALQAQARYIGHIETNLARLGGKTDQAFLAAPVPNSSVSEDVTITAEMATPEIIQNNKPHPKQSPLHS